MDAPGQRIACCITTGELARVWALLDHLTGHARAVAADVRRLAAVLPKNDGCGALAEVVLREADGRLSAPLQGTARCVQNRARLVQALYARLDRLTEPDPAAA